MEYELIICLIPAAVPLQVIHLHHSNRFCSVYWVSEAENSLLFWFCMYFLLVLQPHVNGNGFPYLPPAFTSLGAYAQCIGYTLRNGALALLLALTSMLQTMGCTLTSVYIFRVPWWEGWKGLAGSTKPQRPRKSDLSELSPAREYC